MKNVQIVDSADNCVYDVFEITDEAFKKIFIDDEQDLEFYEDILERYSKAEIDTLFTGFWDRPVEKRDVVGIHGTIFYGQIYKKKFFPKKKWDVHFSELGEF